jgi:hypothetical protein
MKGIYAEKQKNIELYRTKTGGMAYQCIPQGNRRNRSFCPGKRDLKTARTLKKLSDFGISYGSIAPDVLTAFKGENHPVEKIYNWR